MQDGQPMQRGRQWHSDALPAIRNGKARLSYSAAQFGGVLRLDMSDSQNPAEAQWHPIASALIEDQQQGDMECTVPARVSAHDYAGQVRWVRAYYGASSPITRYRDRFGEEHSEIQPIEPHTVQVHIEIKEQS
jgi:hypothetical protein